MSNYICYSFNTKEDIKMANNYRKFTKTYTNIIISAFVLPVVVLLLTGLLVVVLA